MFSVLLALSFGFFFPWSNADEHSHRYSANEEVVIWFQNLFPKNNLLETYAYSYFPYCLGTHMDLGHYHPGFLDAIQGLNLENSGLQVNFGVNVEKTRYCSFTVDTHARVLLSYAVRKEFIFDVFIDGLSAHGSVGDYSKASYDIFTSMNFVIHKNDNKIVKIEISQDDLVKVVNNFVINLTYQVTWKDSDMRFEDRYDIYYDHSKFNLKVRVTSLINSLLMMVMVIAFAFWVLIRTLRFDLMRYNNMKAIHESIELGDQYGWKLVHGDVFRTPPMLNLLSAGVGLGVHLFLALFVTVFFTTISHSYHEADATLKFGLSVYVCFSPLSGFISGVIYRKYGGKRWWLNLITNTYAFPVSVLTPTVVISLVARTQGLSRYLDARSFTLMAVCITFIQLPLNFFGGLIARAYVEQGNFPSVVSLVPSRVPKRKWYLSSVSICILSGLLPFGTIAVEIYYVFTSFWSSKMFLLLHFLVVILLVMAVITICTSIISTYILLNSEDYRWHWMSIYCGMTVGLYTFMYAINYQMNRTSVAGAFQLTFYYTYSFLISFFVGLVCGSLNYLASSVFIYKLYGTVKSD